LLTPTAKKYQDGTRAVARQVTNDILPKLGRAPPQPPTQASLEKVGTQLFNALSSNFQQTLQDFQSDLVDPINRIPQRLSKQQKQAEDILKEARNIFLETPEGLQGPLYTVVESCEPYEIREYPGYMVASTTMEEEAEDLAMVSSGTAFNTLATYLFGANDQAKPMSMTTPVTTTSSGDMRFYLLDGTGTTTLDNNLPLPLENAGVQLKEIPPARLAVRKFTGFVTDGEVARQKDTLLSFLGMDGVELDVAHGAMVPHLIFQYNPPYTLPMVRRNEIAVPVVGMESFTAERTMKQEWSVDDENDENDKQGQDDVSPSDY
jgi:hypothetical protein